MKTDFQPEEILRSEDLNANFIECAGKQDALTAGYGIVIEGNTISCSIASGSNVVYIGSLDATSKLNIDETSEDPTRFGYGKLCFIINDTEDALGNLISATAPISYHQNASSLSNKFFMIRVYRYLRGESDYSFFVEVVGAWDDPQ